MKLSDVAEAIDAETAGDASLVVTRLVHPADATAATDLAMALTGDAVVALAGTRAGAAVVNSGATVPAGLSAIVVSKNDRMILATLTRLFDPGPQRAPGVHPTASVALDARVADDVSIGPLAVVGSGSTIGAGTALLAGATVGAGVTIGSGCIIHPGARIGDRVRMGDRVIIHANAVIGADGFSFIPVRNPDGSTNPIEQPARIHALGTVVIGDDVEIGAATTIDRGTLRDTRIGRGTKIDNQVQIAHNVVIGESCLICGQAGIAGSVVIGDRVLLGARAGIADHVTIASDAAVAAMAGVASEVPAGATVSGMPAMPHKVSIERYMNVGRLKTLYPQVDALKKRIEGLEKGGAGG
jgi:UDP-3-O-[3-hydroxymyristoyl] glucosamine N-acyltransferase